MTPATAEIRDTDLADALGERYLSYALSTIMARSLPDVRDGLKPVHRRLLYAMLQLGLDPASGYKKAARVVGDVIGKFHPHGDLAVYEALVRLAQDFAVRYPLVDGQGNFGNIDGDNAAAMRYTEARLTAVAEALLAGIDEDAVDLRATYDGESAEPVVLPAAFPNLLANGATGIAVGMATSIPPHNAGELCDALLHLIQQPKAAVADLLGFVKGPDFPTGGVLIEPADAIRAAYETGRGSFRVRARWETEKLKGGTFQVVVTEIPYQVQKARLIERIAELLAEKKLALLADVRDESTEAVRVVLEPKSRNVDPAVLMESLFRQTELEARISLNMNVLDAESVPRVMDLKQVLRAFLDHRQVVLQRVSRHRLAEIVRRLEVLQGYLIVYLNIDAVIRIIRNEDEPKPALIKRFKLTDVQADAILNMRLRNLRKLEEMEIRKEVDALSAEGDDLRKLLDSEKRRWKTIAGEIAEMRKKFGGDTKLGRRRTQLSTPPVALVMPVDAYVEKEPLTVLCSEKGWVRALRGHDVDAEEVKYKEGDAARFVLKADSTDRLLLFATDGRFYTLAAGKLPRGRGFGEPIRLAIDLANDQDVVAMFVHQPGARLVVASDDGRGFVVEADDAVAQTRAGKQVLTPGDGARAHRCAEVKGDHLAVIGDNRKLLIFPLGELPVMARGRGVTLQKYHDGGLSDVTTFSLADGLALAAGERTRTMTDLALWVGKRAQAGRMPPHGVGRDKRFA
ncbi:MAG TPA: DNA topoisomerase IV subunit A [Candidatus Sulfotelmatobacter sp.]|nr:DNA topoisomerase IV subunit A [Candidatus Sulfotelmatobacter sp.]